MYPDWYHLLGRLCSHPWPAKDYQHQLLTHLTRFSTHRTTKLVGSILDLTSEVGFRGPPHRLSRHASFLLRSCKGGNPIHIMSC